MMNPLLRLSFTVTTVVLLISSNNIHAFTADIRPSTQKTNHHNTVALFRTGGVAFVQDDNVWRLRMSSSSSSGEEDQGAVEEEAVEEEAVKAEVVVETEEEKTEDKEEEEKEEEPKEDPALTALKEEIASLEVELKAKRVKLSSVQDLADDYTENGYKRKCADIDNMRRLRTQASASNQVTSRARIIANFLPVLENLQSLDVAYGEDEFAKGYGALPRDFANCLKALDVAEFTVVAGEALFNADRCTAVTKEFSDDVAKDVVLRVESSGYEVQGNVIRPAKVVVSLGKEADAEEKKEEEKVVEEEK